MELRARPLVIIELRGGADGLALVPPLHAPALERDRPQLLGKPTPLTDRFGLHPALAPLRPLMARRQLGIVHAVGLPGPAVHSHFAAMKQLAQAGATDGSGWLCRHLAQTAPDSDDPLHAVAIGDRLPLCLAGPRSGGPTQVTALPSLAGQQLPLRPSERARVEAQLGQRYAADPLLSAPARHALAQARALRDLPRPKRVARGFKAQVAVACTLLARGTQFLHLHLDGWDSHARQPATIQRLATQLAWALVTLASVDPPVTVVAFSEFGRRIAQNASHGSDHGHGGVMFLLGPTLPRHRAGVVSGDWPGVSEASRSGPGDLAVTTDVHEVIGEVIGEVVGA